MLGGSQPRGMKLLLEMKSFVQALSFSEAVPRKRQKWSDSGNEGCGLLEGKTPGSWWEDHLWVLWSLVQKPLA